MLTVVVLLKGAVEVAMLLVLARSMVFAMSLGRHDQNPVHRVLKLATRPVDRLARVMSPRLILDQHLPVVSFFLLFWLWIALVMAKVWIIGTPSG